MNTHTTNITAITLKVSKDCIYRRELIFNELIHSLEEYAFLTVRDENGEEIKHKETKAISPLDSGKPKKRFIYSKETMICEVYTDNLTDRKSIDSTFEDSYAILMKFDKLKTYDDTIDEESLICLYSFCITLHDLHIPFSIEEIGLALDSYLHLDKVMTLCPSNAGGSDAHSSYLRAVHHKLMASMPPRPKITTERLELIIAADCFNEKGLDLHSITAIVEQYNFVKMTDDEKDALHIYSTSQRLKFLDERVVGLDLYSLRALLYNISTIRYINMSLDNDGGGYDVEAAGSFDS